MGELRQVPPFYFIIESPKEEQSRTDGQRLHGIHEKGKVFMEGKGPMPFHESGQFLEPDEGHEKCEGKDPRKSKAFEPFYSHVRFGLFHGLHFLH